MARCANCPPERLEGPQLPPGTAMEPEPSVAASGFRGWGCISRPEVRARWGSCEPAVAAVPGARAASPQPLAGTAPRPAPLPPGRLRSPGRCCRWARSLAVSVTMSCDALVVSSVLGWPEGLLIPKPRSFALAQDPPWKPKVSLRARRCILKVFLDAARSRPSWPGQRARSQSNVLPSDSSSCEGEEAPRNNWHRAGSASALNMR